MSTLQLRAFCPIAAFADNTKSVVSPIGELSDYGLSFSRDVQINRSADAPDVQLLTFSCLRDSTRVTVDAVYYTTLLTISQWLYTQSLAGSLGATPSLIKQALQSEFGSVVTVNDVGAIATNGTYRLPSFISVSVKDATDTDNTLKVWYSDPAWRTGYELYEYVIVPPFDVIDDFFLPSTTVIPKIQGITHALHDSRVMQYRGDYPSTTNITLEYDYVNPDNTTATYSTPWTVIVYGAAGNNKDLAKDAIVTYILANSTHTKEEWAELLPDAIIPTEFYIIPLWDRQSLPNLELVAAFGSPTVPYSVQLPVAQTYCHGVDYTTPWLTQALEVTSTMYRSLALLVAGNPKNLHAKTTFSKQWPDYALISSTAIDFNRIDPTTRGFITVLQSLLIAASGATEFSELPVGISRVKRGGQIYLLQSYLKCDYLVPIRAGFVSE